MGSDGSERFSIPCGWPWKDRRQMVLALFSPLTLFSPLAQQEGDPRTPGVFTPDMTWRPLYFVQKANLSKSECNRYSI